MKKKLAVLLACVLFTACAKTPEKVKEKNSSQAEPTEISQSSSTEDRKFVSKTVTESDFAKCVEDSRDVILSGSYDNLKIDNDFKVVAKAYPNCIEAFVPSDFEKNADSVFGLLMLDKTKGYYSEKKQPHTDPETGKTIYEYSNEQSTGFIGSDGIVSVIDKDYMGKTEYGTNSIVDETRNLVMPVKDDKISLGAEKLDLRDMEKAADEKIGFIYFANKDFKYRAYSVSTLTEPSGETLAFMHYRRCYDDVPVFDCIPLGDQLVKMPALCGTYITFNAEGRIVQLNTSVDLEIKEKTKPVEILTPEYAFETASKALAPHIAHTARFEELVLLPTVENKQGNAHIDLRSGNAVSLRPYWIIHFETDWWKEVYAAVDAQTGEVDYVNNQN